MQQPQHQQMPPQQRASQQMPQPQTPYPPGQPPTPGYSAGVPGSPYGGLPYGSQIRLPSGAPQPGVAPQSPPTSRAPVGGPQPNAAGAPPAIAEQQQLLQQLLGQPGASPAAPGGPVSAARPKQGQPPTPRPAAQSAGQELPLMDQLPPIK